MNNSLLEIDKPAESPSFSNVNDIGVLRRQMKEQQTRLEASYFFSRSIRSVEDHINFRTS
jgi:hypothetical protein